MGQNTPNARKAQENELKSKQSQSVAICFRVPDNQIQTRKNNKKNKQKQNTHKKNTKKNDEDDEEDDEEEE